MKKSTALLSLVLCISLSVPAQLTESFETGLPTSGLSTATDYTLASGVWNVLKGASSSTAHSGSLGLKLSAGSSSAPTYASAPAVNAVSAVSFWAKGSSGTTVTLLKSVNGGAYTEITTKAITTTFTQYTVAVNETGSNVRIRFANATSQTHYIDDVSISGGTVTSSPAITTSLTTLPSFGYIVSGSSSAAATYTVSGSNLTADITITASTGFSISTNNSLFNSSINLSPVAGSLAPTTIYVKFAPASPSGNITGNIAHTSAGATTINVSILGNALAAEPTTASVVSFGTVTDNSIIVNTSGGNGANRIIVARAGSAVSYIPADATAPGGVNSNYSSATDQGSGNKIVYAGTGNTVTVTGLTAGTTYYFAVFEYNAGTGSSQNYLGSSFGSGNKATTGTGLSGSLTIGFNATLNAPFLNPQYVSGVISDPTDPAKVNGIALDIKQGGSPIPASAYTITATSSKTSVVTVANAVITKADGVATVKITPSGVGYTDIKLTLAKSGSSSVSITIKYAASAASSAPASTNWHTGNADASAAIALDDNYMVIGDDEKNNLYVFDRLHSGLPVKTFYYGNLIGLTDGNDKEIDLEAAVKSPVNVNRVYWMSSLGEGNSKPNINQIFATTITGTGANTSFSVVGKYSGVRARLLVWGDANGYSFTSNSSKDPKTINGINVEGMCMGPDNTTLFIGFRAPLVPTANRTRALIAPLLNFENWFNNGSPSGNPTFGAPIELNLGGRGIRDIVRLSNGQYIIIAGNYAASPLTGAVYKWSGIAADAPVQISSMSISALNAESVMEIKSGGQMVTDKLQILTDNGSTVFYNDAIEAKDLSQGNYKKFRTDIVTGSLAVLNGSGALLSKVDAIGLNAPKITSLRVYPNPATSSFSIQTPVDFTGSVRIFDARGVEYKNAKLRTGQSLVNTNGWPKGYYTVSVYNAGQLVKNERILVQ